MTTYINIFKDDLFKPLEQYNDLLIKTINKYEFGNGKPNAYWFDPKEIRRLPLTNDTAIVPNPLAESLKFNLFLYTANYPALFLINLLYGDKKDVLIEDWACGAGRMFYYLTKLGFNNFSLIDNYSQISKEILDDVIKLTQARVVLNDPAQKPVIFNIVGYPWFEDELPLSAELACIYPHDNLCETLIPNMKKKGYVELCWDVDILQTFLCKPEKYDEFFEKIKPYKI